jgi:hypothetical protein
MPKTDGNGNHISQRALSVLTPQQKRVVLDFLEWYTHKYILDRPDLPEDLKDLKRFHAPLDRAITFWKSIALTL